MSRMITLLAIIALTTATAVVAQEERPQPRPEQQPAEKTFMGEVASINEDAKTLTVKEISAVTQPSRPDPAQPAPEAAAKSMTFHLDAQTDITTHAAAQPGQERPSASAKDTLELKDLNEGDRVSVKYVESGGKHQAKSIEVIRHKTTS